MTSMLTTLADLSFKTGIQWFQPTSAYYTVSFSIGHETGFDNVQLEMTCREWATKAFCVLSLISNLSHRVIHQQLRSSGRGHKVDLTNQEVDFMLIDREIGVFTESTIRLKDSASYILERFGLLSRHLCFKFLLVSVPRMKRLPKTLLRCSAIWMLYFLPWQNAWKKYRKPLLQTPVLRTSMVQ
jgi:hypothetical protein